MEIVLALIIMGVVSGGWYVLAGRKRDTSQVSRAETGHDVRGGGITDVGDPGGAQSHDGA